MDIADLKFAKYEDIKDRLQYDKNGRLIIASFNNREMHREYRNHLWEIVPEYDLTVIREEALLRRLREKTDYETTEEGIENFKSNDKMIREFYSRYPELEKQSPYLDYLLVNPS